MYFTPNIIMRLINSGLGLVYITLLTHKRKEVLHINNLIYYLLCAIIWNASYFYISLTHYDNIAFLYCIIVYIVVPLSALFLFYFTVEYSTQKKISKILYLLAIIPIISVILAVTGNSQSWYISFDKTINFATGNKLPVKFGIWFYIHTIYSYMLAIASCIIFLKKIKINKLKNKKLIISLSVILSLFIVINIIRIIGPHTLTKAFLDSLVHFFAINFSYFVIFGDEDNVSLYFMKRNLIETSPFPILFFNNYDELIYANTIAVKYFQNLEINIEKYKQRNSIFSKKYFIKLGEELKNKNSESYCIRHIKKDLLGYYQCTNVYKRKNKIIGKIVNLYDLKTLSPVIDQLKKEAYRDSLCSCYNRAYLELKKEELIQSENLPICMFIVDIDDLKTVNDEFGHDTGDECIITTAKVIKESIRANDFLFRIGGDEFLILLPKMSKISANRLISDLNKNAKKYKTKYPFSFSVGFSIMKNINDNFNNHFKTADTNMYNNKNG